MLSLASQLEKLLVLKNYWFAIEEGVAFGSCFYYSLRLFLYLNQPIELTFYYQVQAEMKNESLGTPEIEGVKRQLFSGEVEHRIVALYEALKYGDAGLDLVVQVFKDLVAGDKRGELNQVMWAAYALLSSRTEPQVSQVLWDYNPYQLFESLNTFSGHDCCVTAIAISPNGQTLATSDRGLIKIWQLHTGQEICTISDYDEGTLSLTFSPEGQTLWSGSYPGGHKTDENWFKIKEWNLQTGEEMRSLWGFGDFALSPDGQLLVTGSANKIKVWDLRTKREIRTFQGICCVDSVAFSSDGETVISTDMFVGRDRWSERIKVWDVKTGEQIRTLGEKAEWCKGFALSPDGQTLISFTDKGTVKVWNLPTGELLRTLHTVTINVDLSLAWGLDGHTLINGIFGYINDTINVWDLKTGREIPTFMEQRTLASIALSRDGQTIVSGSRNGTIKVWGVP